MSIAAIQIPSRRRAGIPAGADSRWLSLRFIVSAAATSALGLVNIARFPYLLSRHGGGAFVLAYLAAMAVLALPVLMAELVVGRRGRGTPSESYGIVARDEGHTGRWTITGFIASGAGLLILAAYAEAAGSSASLVAGAGRTTGSWTEVGWQGIFLGVTSLFASQGLRLGVRPVQRTLLPVALLLLVGLLVYSGFTAPEFHRSLQLVFQPDFARFTWRGVLDAGRLALLSVGVGLGVVVTHGSATPDQVSIVRTSLLTVLSTAIVVVLLAVAALSVAPSDALRGFLLLAGLGASVAVLHPLAEQVMGWTGMSRLPSALAVGALSWALAAALEVANGSALVEWMASLSTSLLVPAAAMCGVLFVGWVMSRRSTRMELGLPPSRLFVSWRWVIRHLAPVALGAMLLVGVIDLVT